MNRPDPAYDGRWTIVVTSRWLSWLPWPTRTFTAESPEGMSWAEAHDLATRMHEAGAWEVSLYQSGAQFREKGK